jgi:signal transduction histidine kinase
VARSQRHLLRLITDILDLSRIEAGRMEYRLDDVPVGEVVAEVGPMVVPQFAGKRITLRVDHAPGLVVRADRERVQAILINLLGDAAKFTPPGGG